jgi:hypothetical protein
MPHTCAVACSIGYGYRRLGATSDLSCCFIGLIVPPFRGEIQPLTVGL